MSEDTVEVSIANLFTSLKTENGHKLSKVAIRHPTDTEKPWQALSAGPKFPESTQEFFVRRFGADREGFSGTDARCRIPEESLNDFLGWLWLDDGLQAPFVDWNPRVELRERLTTNYWSECDPVLSAEEFDRIGLYRDAFYIKQPEPIKPDDRGGRSAKIRFFSGWRMTADADVVSAISKSHVFKTLTDKDLSTTKGGRCIGETADGITLANNLGIR